ncbi:MAG: hypothetical protein HYW07_17250 [Candidatus Latescibacteria bacterium]|nr:hypothetical protein [Candidatus Latescibacterota bacterium]
MKPEAIWYPGTASHVYLVRQLVLSAAVAQGWLECAASGPYQLYLKGQLVGRGMGATLTGRPMWERFELGQGLEPGAPPLVVLAAAGQGLGWFAAGGELSYDQGGRLELATGRPWQAARAVEWEEGPGGSERCWPAAGGERPWGDAAVVAGAPIPGQWAPWPVVAHPLWARSVAVFGEVAAGGELDFVTEPGPLRRGKCVHREGLLRPGKSWTLVQTRDPAQALFLVLDFGQQHSGFPCLRLRGGRGGLVELGFARFWGQLDSRLSYGCGQGVQEWSGLRLRTCRYLVVRLSHFEEEVEIDCLSLAGRRVEVEGRGELAATPVLEQVWETGQRTLAACRQEVYYFPGGQRYDWLRAHALALDDYYLSGDTRTMGAALAGAAPAAEDWFQQLAYVLALEAYHLQVGERDQVARWLPAALERLAACRQQAGGEGLLPGSAEWSAPALNALCAGALAAAGRLCRWQRDKAAAQRWEGEGRQLRRALRQLWDQEPPGAEDRWAHALALHFGLAAPEPQEDWMRRLATAGLLEAFYLEGGLWWQGAGARALEYLEIKWGRLAEREGVTWGEKSPGAEVLPGPEYYLGSQVLGVRPGAPGYQVLEIRPPALALGRVRGKVMTGRGAVAVEWQQSEERFWLELNLERPGDTQLWLPRLGRRFPMASLNGETLWRNEKMYPNPLVQQISAEAEHLILFFAAGGRYEVEVE